MSCGNEVIDARIKICDYLVICHSLVMSGNFLFIKWVCMCIKDLTILSSFFLAMLFIKYQN